MVEKLEVVGEVDLAVGREISAGVLGVVEVEELEVVGEIDEAVGGEIGSAGGGGVDACREVEDAVADEAAPARPELARARGVEAGERNTGDGGEALDGGPGDAVPVHDAGAGGVDVVG